MDFATDKNLSRRSFLVIGMMGMADLFPHRPEAGQRTIIKVKADQKALALGILDNTGKIVGAFTIQS